MSYDSVAEEGVDAMTRAIEELVGDDEVEGFVLFLERSDGRDGDNALDAELLEPVNIGAEVESAGQDAVATSVASQECDLAAFKGAADIGIGRAAKRGAQTNFFDLCEAGHGIEPAASDDSDFHLRQTSSGFD